MNAGKNKDKQYNELNKQLAKLQGEFYTHIKMCDDYILTLLIESLDDCFFTMTGIGELASYYFYEDLKKWSIQTHDKTYEWSNEAEFVEIVTNMIKDYRREKYYEKNTRRN